MYEQIKDLNPVFQEQLFEATTDFFVNKNAQKLIELTKENLSSFLDLTEINIFLKNTIKRILEIFFIEDPQKAYIISLIQTLYENQ